VGLNNMFSPLLRLPKERADKARWQGVTGKTQRYRA
jgi:hypothetical protein